MSNKAIEKTVSKILRAIAQFLPVGATIDILLQDYLTKIQQRRFEDLINQINKGAISIDSYEAQSDEFIHAFVRTAKAASNSFKNEKIELLGNVFVNGYKKNCFQDMDQYEEIISIIEELSIKEFHILIILDEYVSQCERKEDDNDLNWASCYFPKFIERINREMGISEIYLQAILKRIERTGLYAEIVGTYLDYAGGKGYLTPLYYDFKKYITLESTIVQV